MKYLVRIIQFLFGFTFLVSGCSKCIDPAGTAIKLSEYLQFFGLGFLSDLSMGLSWVLCIMEFIVGFQLLVGHARYFALTVSTLLMCFFTPITLWLACTDAIQDCGCFGDFIHLTNVQTLVKNLVLDVLLIILWYGYQHLYEVLGRTSYLFCRSWALVLVALLCLKGTLREPVIDFRPYHPGLDLRQSVGEGDDDGASSEVQYICIYRKDGHSQEFPLDELPDEAEGWEFVETVEHHVGEASANKADAVEHLDLYLKDRNGDVVTSSVLGHPGHSILLLSPSLDQASQHDIDRIEHLYEYAEDNDYPFYCITGPDTLQLKRWLHNTGAEYPFLFTDVTIIQTIARSNPAVMLLNDGVICWKKPLSVLDVQQLSSAKLSEQTGGEIEEITPQKQILWLIVLLFAPLFLFLLFEIPKLISNTNQKKDSKDA